MPGVYAEPLAKVMDKFSSATRARDLMRIVILRLTISGFLGYAESCLGSFV
jgi:hypothetical protein